MVEIKLYDIGEGIHEGDVVTYFVKVGDRVSVDQPLVEVQTEKMVAELPSPVEGTIKEILIETGKTITVGTTLLTIEAEGEAKLEPSKDAVKNETVEVEKLRSKRAETQIEKSRHSDRIVAAPYTRKIARENNIDINLVKGSGPAGRILEEDIYRYLEQGNDQSAKGTSTPLSEPQEVHIETADIEPDVIPFKGIRKQIANKMVKSLFTIPHVAQLDEIDMTNLLEYRKELKALGLNISVVAFFLKALAVALKEFPVFNAKLDEENEQILLEKVVHIGLATDTENGLIVPVLRNVHIKSLRQIQDEMKELTKKAQEGKLSIKEMSGSTFTISNVGPMGSIGATPIINYPETGLMAFHKTKKMPVVNEQDEIVIRSIMNFTLSFDHRVTDGGTAVTFTNRFKALIENPKLLTIELT